MIAAYPNETVEFTATGLATGLVGSLTVSVEDGQGGVVTAPTADGIVESPAGSGIYTATLSAPSDAGSYVVVFYDSVGDVYGAGNLVVQQTGTPGEPIPGAEAWTPTAADVALILPARTKDTNGTEVGAWTADTRPTREAVESIIEIVAGLYPECVNADLASDKLPLARHVLAIRAAIYVEVGYFPEQIGTERSPVGTLTSLFDSLMATLCPGATIEESPGTGSPGYADGNVVWIESGLPRLPDGA